MDPNDLYKVWEIKTMKKPRDGEAREILQKVAKQVQPIMRRRKWQVQLLSEFWPEESLLGLNRGGGDEIRLRLRRSYNELEFYPYQEILDTMLHELSHNDIGGHGPDFHKLWDELRKECEELMVKGALTQNPVVPDSQSRRGLRGDVLWQCNKCTLLNPPVAVRCEACDTPKSATLAADLAWSCKFCTLDNGIEVDRCMACGERRRYSYTYHGA